MNLKDFVETSLLEIMEGVATAQKKWNGLPDSKGVINPIFGSLENASKHSTYVKFDVAVTVSESAEGSGKAGLKVWSAEVGATGSLAKESSTISRVEFEIPINPSALVVTEPTRS